MQTPGIAALAPGVPVDYYRHLDDAEQTHWWYRGMHSISAELLGERMHSDLRVLDAGCGTGGFLRFLLDDGDFSAPSGADVAEAAIALARERVPEADLRVAALRELPFEDEAFDLVAMNDVLQHVAEAEVGTSLREVGRVLARGGTLFLRTNGVRRLRRERADWRAYDRKTLRGQLEAAGFVIERVTHANCLLSLAAAARGRVPHAPTSDRDGIPAAPSRLASAVGRAAMGAESMWLGHGGSLAYGHTLLAIARSPVGRV